MGWSLWCFRNVGFEVLYFQLFIIFLVNIWSSSFWCFVRHYATHVGSGKLRAVGAILIWNSLLVNTKMSVYQFQNLPISNYQNKQLWNWKCVYPGPSVWQSNLGPMEWKLCIWNIIGTLKVWRPNMEKAVSILAWNIQGREERACWIHKIMWDSSVVQG